MKFLIMAFLISSKLLAQDPLVYLRNFDSKNYSLKTKGVKDLVVDIESDRLTKQINDHQLFGKVKELVFRVHWTAEPERTAIEVIGLPDGFKEIKEDLKLSILPVLDILFRTPIEKRFQGYKFLNHSQPREILAKDMTSIAPIPSFILKFDQEDKLVEIIGNKPVGSVVTSNTYEKKNFTDGRWVLTKEVTEINENGQNIILTKDINFMSISGIGVGEEIKISTEQKSNNKEFNNIKLSELVNFSNYRINEGAGMRYFLGEGKK